jgi:hypothetical protein
MSAVDIKSRADRAREIIASRRQQRERVAAELPRTSAPTRPTSSGAPEEPWLCQGGWCAGCEFERLDGNHPRECACHDPVDVAGWLYWRDELPPRAVAAIKEAHRQGVALPQALLERVP